MFDIVPDIITSAKGLTSGYVPLGAFFVSDRLYATLTGPEGQGKYFTNGFTYSAHPVACAAALASLDIIEREKLCDHVKQIGPHFQKRFAELADMPVVGDVRGMGLMLCVEYVKDRKTKEPMPAEWDFGNRIIKQAMPRGLLVRPMGHLVVLSPPLTITAAQIDEAAAILRQATNAVMDDLVKEGLWHG